MPYTPEKPVMAAVACGKPAFPCKMPVPWSLLQSAWQPTGSTEMQQWGQVHLLAHYAAFKGRETLQELKKDVSAPQSCPGSERRCSKLSLFQLHLCKALIIAQPRVSIVILWHQQAWHIANSKETISPHEDKLCSFSSYGSVSVGKKGLRGESIFEIWGEVEESHTYTHSPSPPLHLNKITVTGRINYLAVYRVSYHVKVPQGSF